jgi:subtilisin family serine protease
MTAVIALVSACSGGGGSGGGPNPIGTTAPQPTASATGLNGGGSPSPSPTGTYSAAAFTCPTSDTVASTQTSRGAQSIQDGAPGRRGGGRPAAIMQGRLVVTYDLPTLSANRSALVAREASQSASLVKEFDYASLGTAMRLLNVPVARAASIAATLRAQSGVRSVAVGQPRLVAQTVTTPYFTNDPYFTGFTTTVPPAVNATAPPATFEVGPYEETANVPGQWNMHAIGLEYAFGYSQTNNGSAIVNAGALGSSGVKIAIIDVGEDTTHPELTSKVAYQKCFITNPSGQQSTSNFTTDPFGHGTDVAGIAAAATNNALGFAGAGGNSSIYAYRVEATPDDNCVLNATAAATDPQCSSDTADIASAIDDAVANGVNVINLSLGSLGNNGGAACSNGTDLDPVEGAAIENAIAKNVIVVAAAGNDADGNTTGYNGGYLEAPACDTGVIAAGATSLADGQPNGFGNANGSSAKPTEYVASYSDYGTPGAQVNGTTAWGIVAPGGDPSSDNDLDDLHWIEDIWTTQPFDANYAGECAADYPGTGSTIDCRTLIAGTSMATPTVAGAAALILAATGGSGSPYQSPAAMKSLLCSTADDIGDAHEGCGRLDVYRAMAKALGDTVAPQAVKRL